MKLIIFSSVAYKPFIVISWCDRANQRKHQTHKQISNIRFIQGPNEQFIYVSLVWPCDKTATYSISIPSCSFCYSSNNLFQIIICIRIFFKLILSFCIVLCGHFYMLVHKKECQNRVPHQIYTQFIVLFYLFIWLVLCGLIYAIYRVYSTTKAI